MRPSWDKHYMDMAVLVSKMGTCHRRQVGCVLVDERNVILATGFNGVPPKWPHCRGEDNMVVKCPGAEAPSGTALDSCMANHAEQNALIHCPDPMKIKTVYTTTSPCVSCVKVILCTGATRIVFLDEYPQREAKQLWMRHSRPVIDGGYLYRTWEQIGNDGVHILGTSRLK